jgi:acetyl-CoA synthetase
MTLVAPAESWEAMRANFRWPRIRRYNIAHEICEKWAKAEPDRVALKYLRPDGDLAKYSYAELSRASARLANALRARGVERGDRVAILLPQTPETTLTHIACYKIGAIALPLFTLFGEDGLIFRLKDSAAKALITDAANLEKVLRIREDLDTLQIIYSIDHREKGVRGFWQDLGKARDRTEIAKTSPDDPAFLSYTSGTTGPAKGALHGHKVLLGHLPGAITHHDFAPQPGDCFWTPADWAWLGGLGNVMLPSLALGVPLIAHRMAKFDPDKAFWLMNELEVRNSFLPPTALKLMRSAGGEARLRSVGSGGEALAPDLLDWGEDALGVTINEFYGQTECNLVLGNASSIMCPKPGSTGKAVPGYDVRILDAKGRPLPPGEEGEIAISRGGASMFLGYWGRPKKTEEKFSGRWMLTGDLGHMDEEGYVFFSSRTDDVITTSGYRVGPSEVEHCLNGHPDVVMAGVIGVPDPVRTEAIKAFVVLKEGRALDTDALVQHVRTRLSPHLAPRDIEAIDALPLTASGKILRRQLRGAEAS